MTASKYEYNESYMLMYEPLNTDYTNSGQQADSVVAQNLTNL
jgi:hypothetical protein